MKNFFLTFSLIVAMAAGMTACGETSGSEGGLTLSTNTLSFDATADTEVVTVTGKNWTAIPNAAAWIDIDADLEAGEFTVTVEANPEARERTGTITVKNNDDIKTVSVTQAANENPEPSIEDYLGEYTITSDLETNVVDYSRSWNGDEGEGTSYSAVAEMKARPEIGENIVSINVEPGNLFFTYDPETHTLRNNNRTVAEDSVFSCTFGYVTKINDNGYYTSRSFAAFPEGEMAFSLDENNKLTIPAALEVDGEEKTVYVLEFNPTHGVTWSLNSMLNIEMVKND